MSWSRVRMAARLIAVSVPNRSVSPGRTAPGCECLGVAGEHLSAKINARRAASRPRDVRSERQGGQTMTRIAIYDTSLRDGSQGEGVNFSLQDKLSITARL